MQRRIQISIRNELEDDEKIRWHARSSCKHLRHLLGAAMLSGMLSAFIHLSLPAIETFEYTSNIPHLDPDTYSNHHGNIITRDELSSSQVEPDVGFVLRGFSQRFIVFVSTVSFLFFCGVFLWLSILFRPAYFLTNKRLIVIRAFSLESLKLNRIDGIKIQMMLGLGLLSIVVIENTQLELDMFEAKILADLLKRNEDPV